MSAQDVERALAVRYRARQAGNSPGKVTFHCKRLENDGTIQLHDVDYKCDAVGADFGYWVGTDSHRITEIQAYF